MVARASAPVGARVGVTAVANALEPPLLESEELEPLVSTGEKPLVRLQQPELEQKLPDILEKSKQGENH